MSLIATSQSSSQFKQPPEGTHVARAVQLIDLGTQKGEFAGEPTIKHQIVLRWELPFETVEVDGEQKPMLCSKFWSLSTHEKSTMRKDVESWMGRAMTGEEILKGYDLRKLLGKACQVTIKAADNGKTKVVAVTGLAKGMTCPPQVNPSLHYEIEQGRDDAFKALPAGFQKMIEACEEWNGVKRTKPPASDKDINGELQIAADEFSDEIPF